MTRWTPRYVIPPVLLAAFAVVIAGRREWFAGRIAASSAVGAGSPVTATGADAVPGLIAFALVIAAGILAAATSGPVLRRVTLVVSALAGMALTVLTALALTRADDTLGTAAATASGLTGNVPVTAITTSPWPYVVFVAAVVATLATILGLLGAARWRGLSQRYEAPVADGEPAGGRGERVASAWDQVDRGMDPTVDVHPDLTADPATDTGTHADGDRV